MHSQGWEWELQGKLLQLEMFSTIPQENSAGFCLVGILDKEYEVLFPQEQ